MKTIRSFLPLLCLLAGGPVLSAQTQLGEPIVGTFRGDQLGVPLALSGNGRVLALGAPEDNIGGSGYVRVYDYAGGEWRPRGTDFTGRQSSDNAGAAVALSTNGRRLAFGTTNTRGQLRGRVRVVDWDGSEWTAVGEPIDNPVNDSDEDLFGLVVALSGDGKTLAVSAPFADLGGNFTVGRAFVYRLKNGKWEALGAPFTGSTTRELYASSLALSADGNRLVLGNPQTETEGKRLAGTVVAYDYRQGEWEQVGAVLAGEELQYFGTSISLTPDGKWLAAGGHGGSRLGTVRVYELVNRQWKLRGGAIGDGAERSRFGETVGLSDDGQFVAVGAPRADGRGSVRIFGLREGRWEALGAPFAGGAALDGAGAALDFQNGRLAFALPGSDEDRGRTLTFDLADLVAVDHPLAGAVSIYPNPTATTLHISGIDYGRARLLDAGGRILAHRLPANGRTVYVADLAPGTYFLQLRVGRQWLSKAFVKQ